MNPLDNPQTEIPTRTSDPLLVSALYLSQVVTVVAHSAPLCPASNAFYEVFWTDTRLVLCDKLAAQYDHIYQ